MPQPTACPFSLVCSSRIQRTHQMNDASTKGAAPAVRHAQSALDPKTGDATSDTGAVKVSAADGVHKNDAANPAITPPHTTPLRILGTFLPNRRRPTPRPISPPRNTAASAVGITQTPPFATVRPPPTRAPSQAPCHDSASPSINARPSDSLIPCFID